MAKNITIDDRNLIINIAKLYLNSPYKFGGEGTLPGESTDCSKFTQTIYNLIGISLERNSSKQGEQFSKTGNMLTDLKKAEIGDLIFFKNTYESENEITHVGIYLGNEQMIHAGSTKVVITSFGTYRKSHFKGVGQLSKFINEYNKDKAAKSFQNLSGNITHTDTNTQNNQKTDSNNDKVLKAVNAVIAVLTSTRGDLPSKYQDLSAVYAKTLREDYPNARKLENDQIKKVYQSVVDFLSYARTFAGKEEQQKYSDLNKHLREKFNLK